MTHSATRVAETTPRRLGYPPLGDLTHVSLACLPCTSYRLRRAAVLPGAVRHHARAQGITPTSLFARYMTAVHARHIAGLPLTPNGAP